MTKKLSIYRLFYWRFNFFSQDFLHKDKQKAALVVQLGHSNTVGCTTFSNDGRYIVTGDGYAGVLILWQVESGLELRRFTGSWVGCKALAISHDNKYLASVTNDGTLRKWNLFTGKEVFKKDFTKISNQKGFPVYSAKKPFPIVSYHLGYPIGIIKFSKDNKKIITSSINSSDSNGLIQEWNSLTGELLSIKKGNCSTP